MQLTVEPRMTAMEVSLGFFDPLLLYYKVVFYGIPQVSPHQNKGLTECTRYNPFMGFIYSLTCVVSPKSGCLGFKRRSNLKNIGI